MNILRLSTLSLSLAIAVFTLGFATNPASAAKPDKCTPWPECRDDGGGGGQTTDTTAPALIDDFRTYLPTSELIRLQWTATGDDGYVGTADHYTIRQAEQVTCSEPYDFTNAVELPAPWPREAGRGHEIWAEGLNPETCYVFSIQPFDEAGNTPGPSFDTATTSAAPIAGAWQQEILPGDTYSKLLAFDPSTTQPVVFANDASTYYFVRSPDGTWTAQTVKKNGSGSISFDYNPHPVLGLTFGGMLKSHRNVPSYAELQPDGFWDVTQITNDRVRGGSLAFDSNGIASVAFRKVDGRILQLARYNGSSFDIETPEIPGDQGMGWGAILKFDPATKQPTIVYTSEDRQKILIATYNGIAWSVESIHLSRNIDLRVGVNSFEYDPNNQPVIIFGQELDTRYESWMRMIRGDYLGNWDVANAMTIDPDGLINQGGADLAIAGDGTLYVSMANTANQARVGRFCEANQGFSCTPTIDPITLQNIWFWETVAEQSTGGAGTSIAIDEFNSTIAIVAAEYFRCDPQFSVICGSPPAP